MQTFLTKVSQKKIKMIHLLLETERWCSIEELQNELKVSSKSILNYLTDLEELFQNILIRSFWRMRIIGAFLWKSRRTSQSTLFIFISTENHIIIIWLNSCINILRKIWKIMQTLNIRVYPQFFVMLSY